eukprot:CAMPEP_0179247854 /NCGR_PEP_ID=MMETSP0797-20121207/19826_1 /TAXON_ID=47934 /ORGANISM="Dinophysis acuminata, Strain DAEP01" /LENGTH=57 /DNA_ID=CAMNT_0020955491 /DNA_START=336 /DNA_END=508 /DNA_ORIENTATION=-
MAGTGSQSAASPPSKHAALMQESLQAQATATGETAWRNDCDCQLIFDLSLVVAQGTN